MRPVMLPFLTTWMLLILVAPRFVASVRRVVWILIAPLQFDTDGKIVAAGAILEVGFTGMPGALLKGYVLHDLTIAADQRVGGNREPANLSKVVVRVGAELIAEQLVDPRAAELTGRQADGVNYQQVDVGICRARITIGRRELSCFF